MGKVIDTKLVSIFKGVTGLDADEKKADLLLMNERKGRMVAK